VAWLAGWAWDLLEPHYSVMRSYSRPGGLLLPSGLENRCRSDFNRLLATACRRAFGPAEPRYPMSALRRIWQAAAIAAGMPHAVVRQSWWATDPHRLPAGALAAREMAESWSELFGGPAALLGHAPAVPRRAGRDVAPWEPGIAGGRCVRQLPASCCRLADERLP